MMTRSMALLVVLTLSTQLRADDWPHWMGPKRDNCWRETGLLEKFPKEGPKVLWRTPIAGGYAGPAVVDGKVFCTDYKSATDLGEGNFNRKEAEGEESIFCLDAKTGKELWKHAYKVRYTISYPAGPRCTPTVFDGKVCFLGAEGNLFVCEVKTGNVIWKKDLKEEYKTKSALWGYAGHPLIDGDKLITLVGGEGSHVVAFDKATGKELWKALSPTKDGVGYSPPTIIEAAGKRQLILFRPNALTSVDPETGKEYWSQPYEATNGSVIMSPIVCGEHLYVAGWNDKNLLVKLNKEKPGAELVWRDKKKHGISPVNVQPFLQGTTIFGFDQAGELHAMEIPSGKRLWTSTGPLGGEKGKGCGTAFIVKEADRWWFFTEDGELVIGKMDEKGYEEIDRAKLLAPTGAAFGRKVVWCMPAFADKKMFVRNDKEIICVDLAK